jgi:radical SAM superfamily enzyme YgiQ (UPF0313 family)
MPVGSVSDGIKKIDPKSQPLEANLGITSLIYYLSKNGFKDNVDYYDVNNLRPSDDDLIEYLKRKKPKVVGLSGPLTRCYPSVKRISGIVSKILPESWIVVGGHVTSSSDVILQKTKVDVCIVGDGEIPLVNLLNYIVKADKKEIDDNIFDVFKGLSWIDSNKKFRFSGYSNQIISNDLYFPDYKIVEMGLQNKKNWIKYFFPLACKDRILAREHVKNNKYIPSDSGTILYLPTSKGCVAKCTFCQRYSKGYRKYHLDKLEEYIVKMKEKYNVEVVNVIDENFGSDVKQAKGFSDVMKRHNIFWYAGGVRCTTFGLDDLLYLSNNNCLWLKFGIEAGSQKMLDVMQKTFSVADIVSAIENTVKAGISTQPEAFMIGMPGEDRCTVADSARLAAKLRYITGFNYLIGKTFWAMAIPGTPLYEYYEQLDLIGKSIDDKERYILKEIHTSKINDYVNPHQSSNREVHYWHYMRLLIGKREYINISRKNGDSLYKLYSNCVVVEFKELIEKNILYIKQRKIPIYPVVMWWIMMVNLLFPSLALFFAKLFSDIIFYTKKNIYKKKGVKNFFTTSENINKKHIITDNRINSAITKSKRSLRGIVMNNRENIQNSEEDNTAIMLHNGR